MIIKKKINDTTEDIVEETSVVNLHEQAATSAEHELAVLMLDENGMILDCSESSTDLFECSRGELIKQPVTRLLPELSHFRLMENGLLDTRLSFLCRCGHHFLTRNQYGTFSSELSFVLLSYAGMSVLKLIVQPYGNVWF